MVSSHITMCDAYPAAKSINIYLRGRRSGRVLVVIKLNLKSIRDRVSLRPCSSL